MGYIPLHPAYTDPHVHNTDPKHAFAFWIACHLIAIIPMVISYIRARIKDEWYTDNLPPVFEFFGIWLLATLAIDTLLVLTYLITLCL